MQFRELTLEHCTHTADPSTEYGNCSHGDVRLANYTDNEEMHTREGRVEICINNAWGAVCDNLFDSTDAGVFCNQLEGFQTGG